MTTNLISHQAALTILSVLPVRVDLLVNLLRKQSNLRLMVEVQYQGEIYQETLEWLGDYYETPQSSQQRNRQFASFFLQNVANIIAVWNQSRAMLESECSRRKERRRKKCKQWARDYCLQILLFWSFLHEVLLSTVAQD